MLGQFAQATELGFATIAAGLCLSASTVAGQPVLVPVRKDAGGSASPPPRPSNDAGTELPPLVATTLLPETASATRPRGRSAYAERLHRAGSEDQTS